MMNLDLILWITILHFGKLIEGEVEALHGRLLEPGRENFTGQNLNIDLYGHQFCLWNDS